MSKSVYRHIHEIWKNPRKGPLKETYKARLIKWRREPSILKVDRPTRLDRARALGYKAKQGIIVVRCRVRRGSLRRHRIKGGRRAKRRGILKMPIAKNIQSIAEERVANKYSNLEVLNSYWVGDDGMAKYYEVIVVDPFHPSVLASKDINWIHERQHKKRVYRGLTSAGKRHRGLRNKGKGAEKLRPSRKMNWKHRQRRKKR